MAGHVCCRRGVSGTLYMSRSCHSHLWDKQNLAVLECCVPDPKRERVTCFRHLLRAAQWIDELRIALGTPLQLAFAHSSVGLAIVSNHSGSRRGV